MNLFRERTLYKTMEDSQRWQYPQRVSKRPTRKYGAGRDGLQAFEIEENNEINLQSEGSQARLREGQYARRGTVNLIKKMMRHRVNIINQNIEINQESEDDSESGTESEKLRRALRKKLAKDSTFSGRRQRKVDGGVDQGSDDLERGDNGSQGENGDEDDWNNFRTGGVIQLEKNDGSVAKETTGKVIPNRRNFGRKN